MLGPQFTGDSVHKRFSNMESTFRSNERKIRESKNRCSGAGTDDMYKPKWKYYSMLTLLKKTCQQRESFDSLSNISETSQPGFVDVELCTSSKSSTPSSQPINIYYDENLKKYMAVPEENAVENEIEQSWIPPVETHVIELANTVVPQGQPHIVRSVPPSTVSSPVPSQSPSILSTASTTSCSSDSPPKRPLSAPLTFKRPGDDSLFSKRGSKEAKRSTVQDAVNLVKTLAKEDVCTPKLDKFDIFGSYIAARLREMTPEDSLYYEGEIMRALLKPKE